MPKIRTPIGFWPLPEVLIRRLLALALTVIIAACAPVAPKALPKPAPAAEAAPELIPILTETLFAHLPGWLNDQHSEALIALSRSCARLVLPAAGGAPQTATIKNSKVYSAEWKKICVAAKQAPRNDNMAARSFFETWFVPYVLSSAINSQGLITGYYEAELRGAKTRHGRYQTPIYALPPEIITVDLGQFRDEWKGQSIAGLIAGSKLKPVGTRAEIESGAFSGKGLELLWVDDPVDAFFLHVQGSGRVIMEDGEVVRLGFAGRNGHAYLSIGAELVKKGAMVKEQVSMQSIRAWLAANPKEAALLMASNPSFIFFKIAKEEGPIGAQGTPLTPGRSLAVDGRFTPFGTPVWLDTTDPLNPDLPLRRLVIAQDAGDAIKGPLRADLFWGYGAMAAKKAGAMKQKGSFYLLLQKN